MLGGANGSRAGYETARLALARLRITGTEARSVALRHVAEVAARALGVARASVWALKAGGLGGPGFHCQCRFELEEGIFSPGVLPTGLQLPVFLGALADRRVLAINTVLMDPRTEELCKTYLQGSAVVSLLAAPIIRDGNVWGVICLEHVGPPRIWSQTDRDFGACTADMAAVFLEQSDRLGIEASLRERRERELVEQKMAALERLARSIAHDVTNVRGVLDLIGVGLEGDPRSDVGARGAEVRRAVSVGARIVEQMSLFGDRAPPPPEIVRLGALLREIEPVLGRLLRDARFELEVATEAVVGVGRAEMQQLVLNLCLNAGEALATEARSGGASGVGATAGAAASPGVVRVSLREPLPDEAVSPTTVVLVVADNGCGMDEQTQLQMFEPYFSRKGVGRGIGLSIVYGIVERAGGTILVDSGVGRGTTFRIALPIALIGPSALP